MLVAVFSCHVGFLVAKIPYVTLEIETDQDVFIKSTFFKIYLAVKATLAHKGTYQPSGQSGKNRLTTGTQYF